MAILKGLLSTHQTWCPTFAKHAPETSPTAGLVSPESGAQWWAWQRTGPVRAESPSG